MVSELADLVELIESLKRASGITDDHIEQARHKKLDKAGGFEKRQFVEWMEEPEGSSWIAYFESEPEKYPEF